MLYIIMTMILLLGWYIITVKQYEQTSYYNVTKNSYLSMRLDAGRYGEYLTYKYLRSYEKKGARFLFNCYLPRDKDMTTEIDVLMIYKSGLYVFESKNYSGWIFGSEKGRTWTQTLPNGKTSHKEHFLNPIMQNNLHIKWLREAVGGERIPMHSVIVFSERCTLKKVEVSSQDIKVIKRDRIVTTVAQIDKEYKVILSEEQISEIYDKLYGYTQVSQADKEKHVQNIQMNNLQDIQEHSVKEDAGKELICPKCGFALVLRTAKRGDNAGRKFYGCSTYPKCRYMKQLEENL